MSREYVLQPFRETVHLQIDYARELNEQQHAAVTALPGPSLVIAGAGSGKTRTLIYRVAYLLEQGIPPDRLLLLTFTNKAAKEMMRRVADVLASDTSSIWGGTFHSIANRILRRHAERLGYRPDFTILDREDTRELVRASMKEAQIDAHEGFPKPDVFCEILSFAANTEKALPQLVDEKYSYFIDEIKMLEKLRDQFAARKRAANVMDFDDLLILWLKLLREQSDIAEQYQRRFQFILVDEYQDTNRLQSELIDLLAARHHNVMVVGDDSQSIYSWRGADCQNILQFPQCYPEAKLYKIETNYRSTPEILALANAAIAPNLQQFEKQLVAVRKSGSKPVLAVCGDSREQAAFVAQRALQLREHGTSLNEMIVLYRSHFHALELQLELTRRSIPFSITSGMRFFEQAHIKDVVAFLKLALNPRDEVSFKRIVRLLPGVGDKSADKLWDAFVLELEQAAPAWPPSESAASESFSLAAVLQRCIVHAPKKAQVAWTELSICIAQMEEEEISAQASATIEHVLESMYDDYLQETYTNYRNRREDLEQLAGFARQFSNVEDFLTQLALLSNVEADEDKPAKREDEILRLSTVHQAKGLEFAVVFVIMLCDGLFPTARSAESPADEEEERRLFYVALTRAKDELYLSYPLLRLNVSANGDMMQRASRFLQDLPKDLLDEWNLRTSYAY